jgi:kynureninase
MEPGFVPMPGAAGWQISNPPILSAAPLLASLALFDAAGMNALRSKSIAMSDFLLSAIDQHFGEALLCITPRAAQGRGCQLSLRVRAGRDAGRRLFELLASQAIVADWREPDILRIAPVPLYNQFQDLARFIDALDTALKVKP